VGQVDVARYFDTIMEVVAAMAPSEKSAAKKSPPAPMLFYGGIDGRVWRGGTSFDIGGFSKAMKQMVESEAVVTTKADSAKQGKIKTDLRAIDSALKDYAVANAGKYPDSLDALITPDANGHTYLEGKKVPRDPWGREYKYEKPTAEHPDPRVYTYGRDGKPGGEGDDADIDNTMVYERD
jgi:general secretion pathway protein G